MRSATTFAVLFLATLGAAQSPLRLIEGPLADVDPQVIGDFDGDGDSDILAGAKILINDGTGRFSETAASTLASSTLRFAGLAADLNGDGLDDVISFDQQSSIVISLNLGGFAFADLVGPGNTYILPSSPPNRRAHSADVGDVDGDGDVDILFTRRPSLNPFVPGAPKAELWLNTGGPGFVAASAAQFPNFAAPWGRTFLRDLDADGDLDALLAGSSINGTAAPLVILWNDGSGSYTAAATPAGLPTDFMDTEIGDFDGDGRPDFYGIGIFGNSAFSVVLLNSPTGFQPAILSAAPSAISASFAFATAAVDADGDGTDELLAAGMLFDIVGGGLGTMLQSTGTDFVVPNAAYFGEPLFAGASPGRDFDGDGDRDFLARAGAETVVLMNAGNNAFFATAGRFGAALSGAPIDTQLNLGQAGGVFYITDSGVRATGDFDGDGTLDALGTNEHDFLIRTALNDGSGVYGAGPATLFAEPGGNYYGGYLVDFVAMDVDGDGDDDLYGAGNMQQYSPGTALNDLVFINLGGGAFGAPIATAWTGDVGERVPVDWDADGDLDLLLGRRVATGLASPMLYLQNLGGGTFASPVPVGGNHATFGLLVADFDGDGDPDVLQVNGSVGYPAGSVVDQCVLYRNGGGAFTAISQPNMRGYWAAAGDLNGDGSADAVVDGQTWFATLSGVFVQGPGLASAATNRIQLADVDADGDLDLVETPCTVMLNAGGGVFGLPESVLLRVPGGAGPWRIPESKVADLDRDGDMDVLTPWPRVVVNVTRQLAHRDFVRIGGTTTLDMNGTPGAPWFLYASPATGDLATPYGAVLIDPASAQFIAAGTFAASTAVGAGTAALSFTIPSAPALVGLSLHWQGADLSVGRLTNRLTSTIRDF